MSTWYIPKIFQFLHLYNKENSSIYLNGFSIETKLIYTKHLE